MSKIRPYFKDFLDSKSDHLVTFGPKKSGNWLIWQEVGTFGVEDVIFRLCEEVEEGVDVANELEALKKKEMNSFSL